MGTTFWAVHMAEASLCLSVGQTKQDTCVVAQLGIATWEECRLKVPGLIPCRNKGTMYATIRPCQDTLGDMRLGSPDTRRRGRKWVSMQVQ